MDAMFRDQAYEPIAEQPHNIPPWMRQDLEAPDQGVIDEEPEAPEARPGGTGEAPDAGEGRASTLEQEFTHGRSQS